MFNIFCDLILKCEFFFIFFLNKSAEKVLSCSFLAYLVEKHQNPVLGLGKLGLRILISLSLFVEGQLFLTNGFLQQPTAFSRMKILPSK